METDAAVSLLEKALTVWGPLALGWVGFLAVILYLFKTQTRRENSVEKALRENTAALGALSSSLDRVLLTRGNGVERS